MTNVLSLDIGTRRTGVAFVDENTNVPMPMETLHHASEDELIVDGDAAAACALLNLYIERKESI